MVVLLPRGGLQVWGCQFGDHGQTLSLNMNIETSSGQLIPSSCQMIKCVVTNDTRMYIYHACQNYIISYEIDEERNVSDPIRIPTVHSAVITAFAVSPYCLVTACAEGEVGLQPLNGLTRDDFCVKRYGGTESPHGILLQHMPNSYSVVAASFTCNNAMLMLYHVKLTNYKTEQKPKVTHKLVPVFPFAAMSAVDQVKLMLTGARTGRATEEASLSAGGTIACVTAHTHSADLRATAYEWYPAIKEICDEYARRVDVNMFDVIGNTVILRLASALAHLLPPWSATADLPVTPDPAFPAVRPTASITTIRTEILRCIARCSLRKLITLAPPNLKQQELRSALTMSSLLVSIAARAVTIWVPAFSKACMTQSDEQERSDIKLKSTDIECSAKVGAPAVLKSMKRIVSELGIARRVAQGCGSQGHALLEAMKQVMSGVKAVTLSCERATEDRWVLPEVGQEDVASWKQTLKNIKIESPCNLCDELLYFDLSVHTLSDRCPNGHINQLCPATLLHLHGIDAGLMHKVCMSCGTAMSHPYGNLCHPESVVQSRQFEWLDLPNITSCFICGYRLNYTPQSSEGPAPLTQVAH
eukprot:TRINITY_DN38043_c0_g1_i1.p1 TRINITY_DN38043_c0_g1~~TRINITY_DN38043_c0_g1_i1.p1  ORF type:complete len:673 (+),score=132.22 TRINITY_DN38043_c0_g1_i1:262-2019(+)